jgi:tRNA A37 threonylcarbamoyladenosine synthetase subunit TsaC/SUA5/YrdC
MQLLRPKDHHVILVLHDHELASLFHCKRKREERVEAFWPRLETDAKTQAKKDRCRRITQG